MKTNLPANYNAYITRDDRDERSFDDYALALR